ncbi:MAG: hypothetical protein GY870_19200 [archaeon]|nr:hypothetical protein [archaeon]
MSQESNLLVFITNIIALIISFITFILAFSKYIEKRNEKGNKIIRYLLLLLLFNLLFVLSNVIHTGLMFYYFDVYESFFENPGLNPGIIELSWGIAQAADNLFGSLANYMAYIFMVAVFQAEETKKSTVYKKIMIILCISIVVLSILMAIPQFYFIREIAKGFMAAYYFLVFLPLTFQAFKIGRRVKEKVFKKGIYYIGLFGLCMILMITSLIINTIFFEGLGAYTQKSFFYVIGRVFLVIGNISAYLGYIRPGRKVKPKE